ncbi:MAG: DUF481 domain-containing protein [Pseudomonadota bacterium]
MTPRPWVAAGALVLAAVPASAEIPEPVRAMIDAALASGDEAKVRTIIYLAKTTNPDDVAELDAILASFESNLAATSAAEAAAEEESIRSAGWLDGWSGKGELGAFQSTGNAENTGVTGSVSLTKKGINWRHKLRGRADYQETEGRVTREQYFAAYEPNLKLNNRLFAYALAQYERDRFQGFSGRYAVSGGLGYQIIENDKMQLAVKAGPAYRVTRFIDGTSESRIAGLLGVDFDWDIAERLKLTHDTNAVAETGSSATIIVDRNNTSLNLATGLNAKISDRVSARFSYTIEYDSNPPVGAVQTDTLSRITLIYDF